MGHLWISRVTSWTKKIPASNCPQSRNTSLNTSTIPYKYAEALLDSSRPLSLVVLTVPGRECQGSRRSSHIYEINTWLWNVGRPPPRTGLTGGRSVTKTERIYSQSRSRSESYRRAVKTRKARKRAADAIVYTSNYTCRYDKYMLPKCRLESALSSRGRRHRFD